MIRGLIGILFFQCAGEIVSRALHTPVPGPVIGLALLLVFLFIRGECPAPLERVADTLLDNLGLLFVPAAVGVLVYAAQLQDYGVRLLLVVVGSTVLTALATSLVLRWMAGRR